MANISQLKNLDTPAGRPAHHQQNRSEAQLRLKSRETTDFLYELSSMLDNRRYRFAGDTIEGIYTTVDHAGYVTAGQRKAINNIRRGVGEAEL
jgi:hypothetical protein